MLTSTNPDRMRNRRAHLDQSIPSPLRFQEEAKAEDERKRKDAEALEAKIRFTG